MTFKNEHYYASDVVCSSNISWEFNHTLMLIIQKTTGQQTHEIMNTVVAELDKMTKEIGFDLNSKKSGAEWRKEWTGWREPITGKKGWDGTHKRRNRALKYPGTEITFNMVITCYYCSGTNTKSEWKNGGWVNQLLPENCNDVTVKVTLPNKTLKFTTSDMSMILAEGDILDESSDLQDVEIKSSPTLEDKKKRRKTKTDSKIRT
jgi:hypothetical protein